MKKMIMIVCLWVLSTDVFASDISIYANIASYHFDRSENLNEDNFGFALQSKFPKKMRDKFPKLKSINVVGGGFKNSFNNDVYYAGLNKKFGYFGVELGLLTGYKKDEYKLEPFYALPYFEYKRVKIGITPNFLTFQFKILH